jgi:hypothetical protein
MIFRIPDNEVSKEETAKETSDLYDFLEQQEKDERLITNAREKEN